MMGDIQGTKSRRILPQDTETNYSPRTRDSTVERVIDLQEASGDSTPGYENMSQHSNSSYIPVSDEHYASSSNAYYAPAQTATTTASYWPEQDPTWNNQYTAPSSSSYDASYYNVSTTQARGQSYDAGYYATEYSAAFPQQSPWFPATSGDTRTYVQNSTAYDNFVDSSTSPLRRNGDGTHYSHSGTDNC